VNLQGDRSSASANHLLLAGWQAPDLLGMGVIVCDPSGRMLVANQAAHAVLKGRDGLQLSLEGRVCESDRESHKLANAVQKTALITHPGSGPASGCSAIAIQRLSQTSPLTVLISPLRDRSAENPSQLVLLLVLGEGAADYTEVSGLAQLYELTPSEARLATLLMSGCSLKDCCRKLRCSRASANKEIQGMYRKTGARRQVELVSLLIKSKGLARRQVSFTSAPSNNNAILGNILATPS
jgi:DNA-binding CsgD family transcriptional regulator